MITRLLPEQISDHWNIIKHAVEQSLPPFVSDHPDKMNRVLSSLLSDKIACWAMYDRNEEGAIFDAIILTKITFDDISHTKNFLLYSVYTFRPVTPNHWAEGFLFMSKYALANGCSRMIAYTKVPYLIEMANKYDADASFTFVSFDIGRYKEILNNLSEG